MDQRVEIEKGKAKKKSRLIERVSLKQEHLTKIEGWLAQVINNHRGVKISRNDLIAWFIDSQSDALSLANEVAIAKKFYDEERFLRDTLIEFKKCRAQGVAFEWQAELLNNKSKNKKARAIHSQNISDQTRIFKKSQ